MTMIAMKTENERFKKAIIVSITVHVVLLVFIIVSPYIPMPTRKKMIHYVNVFSMPGGGGGGGGGGGSASERVDLKAPPLEETAETVAPQRESLRDLTTPEKMEDRSSSTLRHPVEKPEREQSPPEEKKAVIEKQPKTEAKSTAQAKPQGESGSGSGSGTGIKIGIGSGSGGGIGNGSEYSSEIGLTNFPFSYYLRQLTGRISANWVKSYSGAEELFTTVLFRIYRDGDIDELKIVERSGNASLDRTAVRAVYSSAPFAPLPQAYQYDYLEIQLIFEHKK